MKKVELKMHIDIQHIAKLSRLRIEVDQLEKFEKDDDIQLDDKMILG